MFEKLLVIDVTELTQAKVIEILQAHEKEVPKTFSDILTYVSVVFAAQLSGAANENQNLSQSTTVKILEVIEALLKDKTDPAFSDLKKSLSEHNGHSNKKKLPSHAFRWALLLINATFKIKLTSERDATTAALSNILRELDYAFGTINHFTNFKDMLKGANKLVESLNKAEEELSNAKQETEKQVALAVELANKTTKMDLDLAKKTVEHQQKMANMELEAAAKKTELAEKAAAEAKQEAATIKLAKADVDKKLIRANDKIGKMTLYEQSMKSVAIEGNSRVWAEIVKAGSFWRSSVIFILYTLKTGYDECVADEKKSKYVDPTHSNAQNSMTILSMIIKIASEAYKSETNALERMISSDVKLLKKSTGDSLNIVSIFTRLYHNKWLDNINGEDSLPGFDVTEKMDQENNREGIKKVHFKLNLLANMFGNKDNTSFLPYYVDEAKKYSDRVAQFQTKYSYLKKKDKDQASAQGSSVIDLSANKHLTQ